MMSDVPMKRCTKCGFECELSEAGDWFQRNRTRPDGFQFWCKTCKNAATSKWAKNNPEKKREGNRLYYEANREKENERSRVSKARRRKDRPDEVRQYQRKWRTQNAERERIKNQERLVRWIARNPNAKQSIQNSRLKWRLVNPEKAQESTRRWQKANPEKVALTVQRRRARKRDSPDTFTVVDWKRALAYFHGCCAVCRRPLNDLFETHMAAMDHWIPLSHPDCPGTIPTNIVPLCHGRGGCNNRKHDKLPEQWLIKRYGKQKAAEILQKIETYFAWVREQS